MAKPVKGMITTFIHAAIIVFAAGYVGYVAACVGHDGCTIKTHRLIAGDVH